MYVQKTLKPVKTVIFVHDYFQQKQNFPNLIASLIHYPSQLRNEKLVMKNNFLVQKIIQKD